ncbi:MAG: DNA gyrase/topoisomerase IV subunit A, partial [Bacteroidota bacterium]
KKGNERKVYHAIYRDPTAGKNYVKRFSVTAITRDKEYDVTKGSKGSKLVYFAVYPNSEEEIVTVFLSQNCRAKNKVFDFDFGDLAIKGRNSQGNVLTKYPIRKVRQKSIGSSTLGGRKIWLDETIGRLNTDERGILLGEFDTEDQLLVIYKEGSYELKSSELTHRFDMKKVELVTRFDPELIVTAVHYDGKQKDFYVKRFQVETTTLDKRFVFIGESTGSKLTLATTASQPIVEFVVGKKAREKETVRLELEDFIDIKGWKALGNKLDRRNVTKVLSLSQIEAKAEEGDSIKTGDTVEWDDSGMKKLDQGKLF